MKRIYHVISNTHWDREWRFSFQRNRQMLVEMIDKVLQILEDDPDYRAFHLDSQSVVIEDYLEIRPEKRDLIAHFVRQKRLLIGPWFILPEEFQVGGESLIRNLLFGHSICSEYGHVMKVGYSPFSWGQISQLPQIYRGFGIDVVMFYRGINSLDSPKAEFIWEGADGTRALSSRFSTMPRYNFYFYIYRPVVHNEKITDIEYSWRRNGLPFHIASPPQHDEDYFILKPPDSYYPENLKSSVETIIRDQADDFTTPHVFWAEGHDSSGPHEKTVQIIRDISRFIKDGEVIHSTLEIYAQGLKNSVETEKLKVVSGERRSSQYDRRSGNLYGYTTSARMYLKQINFDCERWLQFYAEPFYNIARLLEADIPQRYLEIAWHLLLQNSAHDSIGGCSLDAIHEDMMNRYKQSREITRGVFERACKHLAKQIDLSAYDKNDIFLVALNPLTFPNSSCIEAYIDIPASLDRGGLRIKKLDGEEMPVQLLKRFPAEPVVEQMIDRPMYLKMIRYHCLIQIKDCPSMGLTTLQVVPVKKTLILPGTIALNKGNQVILENRFLKILINKNGTFNVIDKRNRQEFHQLGYFLDEGEAGHAWIHEAVDPVPDTKNSTPEIKILRNGPLQATALIRHHFRISKNLTRNGKRSGRQTVLPIEMEIGLDKESPRVNLYIRLDNTAESHRLRIMFPLDIPTEYSFGEGQFDVVKRYIEREDTGNWVEQPMLDYPMHHFVDVSDGNCGAAVLVDGLKEYEVIDNPQRLLAITLLRCFRYIIQPSALQDYSHQKGSQCPGKHEFRLAFYPHPGYWDKGQVFTEALKFNLPVKSFQIGHNRGVIPPDVSFFRIEPETLIFSCLKKTEKNSERTIIIRLYNPTNQKISGKLKTFFSLEKCEEVTLEEVTLEEVTLEEVTLKQMTPLNSNEIVLDVSPKKIVTLSLEIRKKQPE
ncbi:MAG: hypothetical protein EH225_02130 [Calditrichaeota bacterium]|nr:hypothetical protein [Calditrichota bacterium]RQW07271.1 MAG: hypothetical protein EH225_02130 [Calditrichota bacterium]